MSNLNRNITVVGLGASAGGLKSFKKFLQNVSVTNGRCAYILVQHLDPNYESHLTEILQKTTELPVVRIKDGMRITADHVYIIPSNKLLTIKNGLLKLSERSVSENKRNYKYIDFFFESLADEYGSRAIAIILSGTGNDGTEGLKKIKEQAGITFAQNNASSEFSGMPQSAIDAGIVDYVLPVEEIPFKILEILPEDPDDVEEDVLDKQSYRELLSLLRQRKGIDFTNYKETTIRRRILRRMAISKVENIKDYLTQLREDKKAQDILYQDLLIPVTEFFRDESVFNKLCKSIFPKIILKHDTKPVRLWITACSTGEEAYSMAICIHEILESISKAKKGKNPKKDLTVQIYGTDISSRAIDIARIGIYDRAQLKNVSRSRLNRYFTKLSDKNYQINEEIRKLCVFAEHNFLSDPPFGKMDFISCRNVLIYFQPFLQNKALTTFHFSLKKNAYLMLGKSETVGYNQQHFIPIDKTSKIFTKQETASNFSLPLQVKDRQALTKKESMNKENSTMDFQRQIDELILNQYAPPGVVVDENMEITYFRGNTAPFLEQKPGMPSHNLLKMAKSGLEFELRNIIHKASREGKKIIKNNIPLAIEDISGSIDIEAIPLEDLGKNQFLIFFHATEKGFERSRTIKDPNNPDDKESRILFLETELKEAREDMRRITEEQQLSNEELNTANEELISSSEELQTLNEELETSKEELQSTNEEITIVNQELINLNEQLKEERNYAEAINGALHESLIILDEDLRVVSANKPFYKAFREDEESTEGRLIYNLGNNQWDIPKLRILLESIIPEKESFYDFEVSHNFESIGQRTMVLNAQQIVRETDKNLILLAIEDITDRKNAGEELKESLYRIDELVKSSPYMFAILEGPDFVLKVANEAILEQIGRDESIIGEPYLKSVPELEEQGLGDLLRRVFETGEAYHALEMPLILNQNGEDLLEYYNFVYQPQRNLEGNVIGVAIIAFKVTSQALLHKKIQESEQKYSQLTELVPDKIFTADENLNPVYYNKSWLDYLGISQQELLKKDFIEFLLEEDKPKIKTEIERSLKEKSDLEVEFRIKNSENVFEWHLLRAKPINGEEKINSWVATATQINKFKEEEKRKEDFLKMVSHELKTPITSIKGYIQLLLSILKDKKSLNLEDSPLKPSLERMENQINRLTRLISEMLDLNRLEEGQLHLNKEYFNLTELVKNTVQDIRYTNDQSNIKISANSDFTVHGDKDRIGQVIINFITNASKYSPGSKNIQVEIFSMNNNEVSVSVQDFGIGISKEDQKSVFKRFYRVTGKNEDTYSGFGIGLYLAKEIIKRHNGKIEVKSSLGEGATFSFILPLHQA